MSQMPAFMPSFEEALDAVQISNANEEHDDNSKDDGKMATHRNITKEKATTAKICLPTGAYLVNNGKPKASQETHGKVASQKTKTTEPQVDKEEEEEAEYAPSAENFETKKTAVPQTSKKQAVVVSPPVSPKYSPPHETASSPKKVGTKPKTVQAAISIDKNNAKKQSGKQAECKKQPDKNTKQPDKNTKQSDKNTKVSKTPEQPSKLKKNERQEQVVEVPSGQTESDAQQPEQEEEEDQNEEKGDQEEEAQEEEEEEEEEEETPQKIAQPSKSKMPVSKLDNVVKNLTAKVASTSKTASVPTKKPNQSLSTTNSSKNKPEDESKKKRPTEHLANAQVTKKSKTVHAEASENVEETDEEMLLQEILKEAHERPSGLSRTLNSVFVSLQKSCARYEEIATSRKMAHKTKRVNDATIKLLKV